MNNQFYSLNKIDGGMGKYPNNVKMVKMVGSNQSYFRNKPILKLANVTVEHAVFMITTTNPNHQV